MRTKHIFSIAFLFIALVLILVIANFNHPVAAAQNLGAASISLQSTPTPPVDSTSVIGSTDGIMLMGAIISIIVIAPMLFRIKKETDKNPRR
jgi:hypothetical protein